MDMNVLVFLVLGILTLAAAVKVVTAPSVMHAAIFLLGSFVTIAGIYFVLSAEFLGVAQLLIYAGAVATVIIFAVMLSDAVSSNPLGLSPKHRLRPSAAFIALTFAATLVNLVARVDWPRFDYSRPDTMAALGRKLFTDYAVPNEVASVILLVALVGAIALSMKEGDSR